MTAPYRPRIEPLLFAGLAVLQLLPVFLPTHLPMQDLPQHLAKLRVLADPGAPGVAEFYTVRWLPAPYVLFYAWGALLGPVAGIDLAARLWIGIYVVGFPLAVRAWLTATSPPRSRLSWLALPLVFNPFYYLGFTNLLMGLPLGFIGLALQAEQLAGRGSRGGRFVSMGVALALYLVHPFALLLFLAMAALQLLAARATLREAWHWSRPILPAVAAFATWAVALVQQGAFSRTPDEAPGLFWYGFGVTLEYLARFLPGPYADPGRTIAAILWLLAGLALILLRPGPRGARGRDGGRFPRRRMWIPAAGVLLLVLVLPFQVPYANYINLRPAPFLAALLLPLIPARRAGGWGFRAVAGGLALAILALATASHLRFDRELAPLDRVLAKMEPGRRMLPLVFDVEGETFRGDRFLDALLHVPAYYHVQKGGVGPYFQALTLFPVQRRAGLDLPAPNAYEPGTFRWEEYGEHYDYFLAYRPAPATRGELFRNGRLAAADSGWMLFVPREPPPPASGVRS